jgi:hypothetical protein
VNHPILFKGKKFHFRCYSAIMGDGSALVYQKSFILSAGMDFDYKDDDMRKHVTNLSVNKRFEGHPGQVTCNMPIEFPEVRFSNLLRFLASALLSCTCYTFLSHRVTCHRAPCPMPSLSDLHRSQENVGGDCGRSLSIHEQAARRPALRVFRH